MSASHGMPEHSQHGEGRTQSKMGVPANVSTGKKQWVLGPLLWFSISSVHRSLWGRHGVVKGGPLVGVFPNARQERALNGRWGAEIQFGS